MKFGEAPKPPEFVTPMRTWSGAPVTQPVQFQRGGSVFQFTPTKTGPLAQLSPTQIRSEAAKIQKMNDFNQSHRINGPEVVFGATKNADGTLTPVRLT